MIKESIFISSKLVGSLWHTTSISRFESIKSTGFIEVEPDLPEKERYGIPFVRSLGGVSLFDFREFDAQKYDVDFPANSISEFIPFKRIWGRSVWLKIDDAAIAKNLHSGKQIRTLWHDMDSRKKFMAEVEGAHIGNIPVSAIIGAYQIGEGDLDWQPF